MKAPARFACRATILNPSGSLQMVFSATAQSMQNASAIPEQPFRFLENGRIRCKSMPFKAQSGMTQFMRFGRSLALTISLAIACDSTLALVGSRADSNPVPACPAVAQLEDAKDIGALQQMVNALHADVMKDVPDNDACDPPLHSTMAMKVAAPLCEIMGVGTTAIFLADTPTDQPAKASAHASIGYMLPYTDDAYQSVVAHLREAGFERVARNPYPELTFRAKFPSWEIDDFYQRGELYAHLLRDTDFKHFTVTIGSAATIRLMSRDLNSCH
jgi:hypothetical protein